MQAPVPPWPREASARYRVRRRTFVARIAGIQGGSISRRQLYGAGLTRAEVTAELRSGRWQRLGRQTVGIGDRSVLGLWWRALLEVGADAALDGVTALVAAGLRNFEDVVHVSVSKGTRYRRSAGVIVHETRRRRPDDLVAAGPPRVRAEVAAVRGALWARSDRQAALVIAMTVQQRLTTPGPLWDAVESVRRDRRRSLIRSVTRDVLNGSESLGELDFARMCRRAGLPTPDRQVVRIIPGGRAYLDCRFDRYRVVVEIDGIHHLEPDNWISDALRQNEVTIGSDRVLRIPVIGLRVRGEEFIDQLRRVLVSAGWFERCLRPAE